MEDNYPRLPSEEQPKKPPINSNPGWKGSDVEELPGEHPDVGDDIPLLPADPWEDGVEKDT